MRTTIARQKAFIKSATGVMLASGAKDTSHNMRYDGTKYDLSTKAGNLTITIPEDQDIVFTVFMKFDEPSRANSVFKRLGKSTDNLNSFSGKYNIHHFDEKDALTRVKQHLALLN